MTSKSENNAKRQADPASGAGSESAEQATNNDSLAAKLRPYLWSFILTALTSLLVLFFGNKTHFLPEFDITCVRAAAQSSGRLYDLDRNTQVITSRLLSKQPDRGRAFQLIEITDDPDRVYESTPPSPLDYAVMLHALNDRGVENLVFTTRLSWDGDLGLSADALNHQLAPFSHASFGLPLTRGATAQELPPALRRSLIPFSQVSGNRRLIPTVNQVALPAVMSDGEHSYAGFSSIESTPGTADYVPMICQWQDEGLIPSLELLALMSAHDVRPDEVLVHCGRHIRLGMEGLVIPIDSYGETALPVLSANEQQASTQPPLKAEELITRPKDNSAGSATAVEPDVFLFCATGEKTAATNLLSPERLAAVQHWSTNLLAIEPGASIDYRRLPLWAQVVIIFDVAFAACWFSGFKRINRLLASLLTAALIYPLLLLIMDITEHWFNVSPLLTALIVGAIVPAARRKHTTLQEDHTSDLQPVIHS
ncbi:hypothetical protein JIN77_03850 [Verrucomicrobiaceae bacterium R5-34]|nr:hypothetical protein [Verrucomicrobiaceae bacterium R5-34]